MSAKKAGVRPAAVAGRFYPAEPRQLRADVSAMLVRAGAPLNGDRPKAVIAPHAGYVYSGAVAAEAFRAVAGSSTARVVLIGPAHYVGFRGVAISDAEAFATPLGSVPVDGQAHALPAEFPFVCRNDAAHAPEHALEVELPFLQVALGEFTLVPLLVGDATASDVGALLDRLWDAPETLIVVSSDLSHYHDYETARRLDAATALRIESGAWAELGPDDACGARPIAGFLVAAERRGLKARRLALSNSGDSAGGRDRVVGYGAWAFEEQAARQNDLATGSAPDEARLGGSFASPWLVCSGFAGGKRSSHL
jgi:AmmeMemoRadiSam system protein B